jgi:hypothetical protein
MTYTPNIPLATQRIADTQSPINANFTSANTIFGLDHIAFDAAGNNGKHKYVTMIDETASPPTPGASEGTIYSKTTGGVTNPYYRRDGLAGTPEFNLLPIKAFGSFTGGGTTVNAFNMSSSRTVGQPVGVFDVNISANVLTGTAYCVLIGVGINLLNPQRVAIYQIVSNILTQVAFRSGANNQLLDPDFFTVTILQA